MLHLKELRRSKGISLKEIGEMLGVAESTVSLYENGKREAGYAVLKALSNYFGVSINYLLGSCGESRDDHENSVIIPILNSVVFSDDDIEYDYSYQDEAIKLGDPSDYFFFKMFDDSMDPQISCGDVALVKKQDSAENGDVCAVVCENSPIMLKRIIRNDSVTVLQPFNPKFKSIFISKNDKLIILGKVIQTTKQW